MPSDLLDNYTTREIGLVMAYYQIKQEDREREDDLARMRAERDRDRRRTRRR